MPEKATEAPKVTPKAIPLHKKTADKVAIVGFTETKKQAPYKDEKWEIWACNEFYSQAPRISALFEIHNREDWGKAHGSTYGEKHLDFLKKAPFPIYMAKKYKDIPNAVAYPWDIIREKFPYGGYLNNSISIMIALALLMEYKEIGVWGVEMAHHTEFPVQRPSVEYWLGIAEGIFMVKGYPKVTIPEKSELLDTPYVYGLQNIHKFSRVIEEQEKEYANKMNQYKMQEAKARDIYNQYYGGMEALKQIKLTRVQG